MCFPVETLNPCSERTELSLVWGEESPDDAVAQADDQDQDPSQRPLQRREQLSKDHGALNCSDKRVELMRRGRKAQEAAERSSTHRSRPCSGCSGTRSRTRPSPTSPGWWRRRSRTGCAAGPSSSRRTTAARGRRRTRTRCTWSWRTDGETQLSQALSSCLPITKMSPTVQMFWPMPLPVSFVYYVFMYLI